MSSILRAFYGAPFLLALPAFAQQAPSNDADPGIIVTAQILIDQAIQRVNETPGGANVVAGSDFTNKLAVSLRDALAFSPGVYAQPRFGQEVRISIRGSGISRGFHMRGLTLLQDGVPINLADDNGDFQELDPSFLQHVEVFRGANALRFGASTLGGAINGVTPTGRSAHGITARIDGGSFNTLRGFASVGVANNRGDAYLAIAGDRSDGDRAHAKRRALRMAGNIGIRLTDTIETRFYANYQNIDQQMPGALNDATVRSRPWQGNFTGDQQRNVESIRLQNRTHIDLGNGGLDVGLFLNAKQLDHPIHQVLDQKSLDWGSYARLDQTFGAFDFTAGVTARFGSVQSRRFINVNGKRGAQTFDANLTARTIDAYAEGRVSPLPGLTLIAGGVFTSGMRRQEQSFPTTTTGRATFDQFSPKFGLLVEPNATVQIYANMSRSHELPGFIELAQIARFVPLDAQRAWTAEIGSRGTLGPVRFDISYYRANLTGELLQFNVDPVNIPASTFNAGKTRHQGLEMAAELSLTPWALLKQTYMWSDFRFRSDRQYGDNRLPVVPQHAYRAALRVGKDALNLTPNVEWYPEGAWADYANSFKARGYALLGLGAEAKISDQFTLFADVRNLTDRKAAGDISAVIKYAAGSSIFMPVERRSAYFGVRGRF